MICYVIYLFEVISSGKKPYDITGKIHRSVKLEMKRYKCREYAAFLMRHIGRADFDTTICVWQPCKYHVCQGSSFSYGGVGVCITHITWRVGHC